MTLFNEANRAKPAARAGFARSPHEQGEQVPHPFGSTGSTCVHVDPAGWGQCAIVCATDQACPPNAACILDPAGAGHCMAVTAYAASTFDAGNGAWLRSAINDIDRDGRPNAQDNCPGVPNPLQENCNRDAERDRRGDELGDACDPVPCPKARSPVVVETLLKRHTTGCAGFEQVRRVRSRIEPDVLASRNLINGVELAQQQQVTQFRFCHVEFPVRTCSVNANQRRDQDFDTLDNFQSNWRDVTLPLLGRLARSPPMITRRFLRRSIGATGTTAHAG